MNKLAIAGRQLMKGNIGNAITALTMKTESSELIQPSRWRNGNFFFGVNGADKAFVWGNYNSSLIAYQRCPIVSAVINKKAQALVNGKRYVMTGEGKSAKEATTPQAKALRQLLRRPNPFQNGQEFRAQNSVYKQIYGYCPVLKFVPVGFEDDFSKWRLWNIPPWMVQVEDTDKPFYLSDGSPFKSIRITYMGYTSTISPDKIFFIRENQISTSTYNAGSNNENASLFLPDSKLHPLDNNISNLTDSLEGRGSLTRDRGPQWLLTNDSGDSGEGGLFPIDPDAKEALHDDFKQYGIMRGQRKAIITDAKLKLQTVGFDVAQLRLLEGEIQDAKMICDGLNYPPYLLGLVDAKFDNQDVAERGLYTNSIIPDANSEDEQWGEALGLEKYSLRIESDYSHVPALQEDDVKRSTARLLLDQACKIEYEAGIITINQWLLKLGEDTIGPDGDVRSTDAKNSNVPLASIIGVGGIQSLIGVLTAAGLSEVARANTLQILFGIGQAEAASMVIGNDSAQQTQQNGNAEGQ